MLFSLVRRIAHEIAGREIQIREIPSEIGKAAQDLHKDVVRYCDQACITKEEELADYRARLERAAEKAQGAAADPDAPDRECTADGPYQLIVAKLEAGVALVCHEDSLNWSKFNHMLYSNAGLIALFGAIAGSSGALSSLNWAFLPIVAGLGSLVSYLFFVTLRAGICCLENHKEIVKAMDRMLADVEGQTLAGVTSPEIQIEQMKLGAVSLGKRGPSRILLFQGPVIFMLLWAVTFMITTAHTVWTKGLEPLLSWMGVI